MLAHLRKRELELADVVACLERGGFTRRQAVEFAEGMLPRQRARGRGAGRVGASTRSGIAIWPRRRASGAPRAVVLAGAEGQMGLGARLGPKRIGE